MDQYLPLVFLLVLAVGFAAQLFVIPKLLGPKRPSATKEGPYESGIVPREPPPTRYPVRFYIVAMIFVILDIEVVFLYPWATIYGYNLRLFGLVEMGTFAAVVFVAFAYLISVGALDWGPTKRFGRSRKIDPNRTVNATIRRVTRPDDIAEGHVLPEEIDYQKSGPAA